MNTSITQTKVPACALSWTPMCMCFKKAATLFNAAGVMTKTVVVVCIFAVDQFNFLFDPDALIVKNSSDCVFVKVFSCH